MLPISFQPYAVILILIISMGLFIWRKWSYDIVALIALAVAVSIGVVPFNNVFSGLDNPAVITVASVMIISSMINKSNIVNLLINKLEYFTQSKTLHIFSFTFFIAFLSAFMNNVGALGLMLPATLYSSLKHKRSPSYILMPIAMASALGGMVTLIGTPPNLIVSNFRAQYSGIPFHMFDFGYAGLGTAIAGILYISLIGWRLLPTRSKEKDTFTPKYTSEIRIPSDSDWIDQPFKQFQKKTQKIMDIVGLMRRNKKYNLTENTKIKSGDHFIIETTLDKLQEIYHLKGVIIANQIVQKTKRLANNNILLETIVATRSKIQKKNFEASRLRKRHKVAIIAIAHALKSKVERLRKQTIQPGDILLIQCKERETIEKLPSMGLMPITESQIHFTLGFHMFIPLIIFIGAILLTSLSLLPVQIAFSGAALFILLLSPSSLKNIYDQIDWPIIILLAAMIPIGKALTNTGGAAIIANAIQTLSIHLPIFFIISIVMLITMFLSDIINNAATAIIMSPIAISLANSMNIHADALLMAVAVGASCAFLTPIGHQNNLLVMEPGKYQFFDYTRLGLPLEIIILLVATPLIYWFWV